MSAIANSQNRRNRRDHRASLARSIDLPRGSRGPRSSIRGRFEAALFPYLFFHHLLHLQLPPRRFLRSRCEIVELHEPISSRRRCSNDARYRFPVSYCTSRSRKFETRSRCTRRSPPVRREREREKKDRCGEQSHCGPLVALGTYISWGPPRISRTARRHS